MKANTRFSIVVCTYDRPDILPRCLKSLFKQNYPHDCYDLIVVDNGPVNRIGGQVDALRSESPIPLYFYRESRRGLSHARNEGIRHARHDFVAFLDDDASADEGWLAAFDETIRRHGADVVGGKVVAVPEEGFSPPPWFHTPYINGFFELDWAAWGYGEGILEIRFPLYVGGGNSCTRKSLFSLDWARYDRKLGRTGSRLLQGEETLLNYFFEKAGYRIYYNPAAVIYHYFGPDRANRSHMLLKAFWGGYSDAWMHRRMFGSRFVIKEGPRRLWKNFRLLMSSKQKGNDGAIFEKKCLVAHDLGYLFRFSRAWELI